MTYRIDQQQTQTGCVLGPKVTATGTEAHLSLLITEFFLFYKLNLKLESCGADTENVRRCLAHGMFVNAAELQPDGSYLALDTHQPVAIHPSSVLFQAKPAYVVFNELLHTSRCYMRDLCLVDADWLLDAAPEYFGRKLHSAKS